MPKYLFQASYTVQGEEGVRAKGGSDRRDAVADTMRSVGGKLESLYFEFGDRDALAIVDLPDNEAAAAVNLIENASGAAKVQTTVLLTPEQVDERSEEHTSELQSLRHLVCRLLLEKKNITRIQDIS